MKNTLFLVLVVCFVACKTTKPVAETAKTGSPEIVAAIDYHDPSTWLLGYFSQNLLTTEPHSEWYLKGFDEYQPDQEIIRKLHGISKDDLSVKIVMGTWCPDSRREVPRFMKVLDEWRFPMEKVTFIGVDMDKQSPIGEFDKLEIQRVPTFILYKNNIEAGRIIENPMTSLEQDILFIIENFK